MLSLDLQGLAQDLLTTLKHQTHFSDERSRLGGPKALGQDHVVRSEPSEEESGGHDTRREPLAKKTPKKQKQRDYSSKC